MRSLLLLAFLTPVVASGCIRAPDVVIVDRRTALEQQASGSFTGEFRPTIPLWRITTATVKAI